MLTLSPLKLLVVGVVALLLVGPDKLPQVARQLGGAWRAFRTFSDRVEEEVRSQMPDLPSTGDIARYARSPVAILDSLAKLEDVELEPDPGAKESAEQDQLVADPAAPPREATPDVAAFRSDPTPKAPIEEPASDPIDPSLN